MALRLVRIAVRELVGFVLRAGDLAPAGFANLHRLHEGVRAHQQLQRRRPPSYRAEVPVSCRVEATPVALEVSGRVDGVLTEDDGYIVEEIKSVDARPAEAASDEPIHWAQVLVYGHMVAARLGLPRIGVQLTYVQLEPWAVHETRRWYESVELARFFADLTAQYLAWTRAYCAWCEQRDRSIAGLPFPFPQPRPGQQELIDAVAATIAAQDHLFVEAPTGIGKTVSTLFPAIQALATGQVDKVFYLTARTVGRTVAEKALADLRRAGLRAKSLTLTARERICFHADGPRACAPETCPFARGYFDRVNDALGTLFEQDLFDRTAVEATARRFLVCPFELSLDLSLWADVIICDYNYVFDPRVYLRRFFQEHPGRYVLLVDEAHNLVDRAREMFSATLDTRAVQAARRALGTTQPELTAQLEELAGQLHDLRTPPDPAAIGLPWVSTELPARILLSVEEFLDRARRLLALPLPASAQEPLTELFFAAHTFSRVAAAFDRHYVAFAEGTPRRTRLRLLCLDPSAQLAHALQRGLAAVFFSATLTPLEFFQRILGGTADDPLLRLPSPFPREHLHVLVADRIATTFRRRAQTYAAVSEAIANAARQRPGNYLAYFPSYRYMNAVLARVRADLPQIRTLAQTPGMSERQRDAFLAAFAATDGQALLGFALMGGIFGEGIDLLGERLIGVVVVGVGLPQFDLERELIRAHFDALGLPGFEYAYTYPGMNRVLQAAGRVIRTDTDQGVVLLIDERFAESRYRELMPAWWTPRSCGLGGDALARSLTAFWQGGRDVRYEPLDSDWQWDAMEPERDLTAD